MKKLLSIVLATVLLLCSLSVAVSAKVYDYEIALDETITVRVGSETTRSVKFVPEYDMKYVLTAESDGLCTYCDLYDAEDDEWYNSGSYENSDDFRLECVFEKGKIYYFVVGVCGNGEDETDVYEFEITLSCGHSFEDGECVVCGEVCEHDTVDFLGFCPCGANYIGIELAVGFEAEYEQESDEKWYRYVPEETGLYLLESVSPDEESDPECELYDADGEWLDGVYDSVGMDFRLYHILEAGETYYYNVYPYYGVMNTAVKFSKVTHTADDGTVHTDLIFEEQMWSNCTEHGYTDGVYCNTCEEYISGHEELELDEYWHIDEDYDYICDLCGTDYRCRCICHSDNWFLSFIWSIANYFCAILGINQECDCGDYHYYTEFYY